MWIQYETIIIKINKREMGDQEGRGYITKFWIVLKDGKISISTSNQILKKKIINLKNN